MRTTFAIALVLLGITVPAGGQDSPRKAPAQRYAPRDVTLETLAHPHALAALEKPGRVLMEDGFESKASFKNYFEVSGLRDGRVTLVMDPKTAHTGRGAVRLVAPARDGKESGAGLIHWMGKKGHDRVYFRRYLRFDEDYDQGNLNHTGGGLAGVATDGRWDQMGKAGIRPKGDDRFTVGFEPWRDWGKYPAPGYLFLYTYWMDMKGKDDGKCWGNMIQPVRERRIVPPRGKWICLEQMVQVNRLGRADGEMAAWIDGRLYLHIKGMRWRKSENLRIKRFRLGIYIHRATRENVVWYDDVVLATGYVGPTPRQPHRR